MAEMIPPPNKPLDALCAFAQKLIDGENGKVLIETYQDAIDAVDAALTMQVFDRLLQADNSFEKVKANTGKLINVFTRALTAAQWEKPKEGHFIYYLMQENRKVEGIIAKARPCIRAVSQSLEQASAAQRKELLDFLAALKPYELHYIKKENVLFPYLEMTFPEHRCLQLMWSFHDDFRKSLKMLEELLLSDSNDQERLNRLLGNLFFVIFPIIFREEQIIFPVALRAIPANGWQQMLHESAEIGWCYGVKPEYTPLEKEMKSDHDKVDLNTGFLLPKQIELMLDHLPVDITYVDANDQVCYFSGAAHRIFPRAKAIIGRKVQNCHPRESVHMVNKIIQAFREGTKDHADFWIRMKDRFIHIRYFALRDASGTYQGTIEVSQDVTEIRNLQGEQRLLDWKD